MRLQMESLRLFREVSDQWGMTRALNGLGKVLRDRGDDAQAARIFEEGLAISQTLGFKREIATALHNLAHLALHRGEVSRAIALFPESLALHREVGDRDGLVNCLAGVAELADQRGQLTQAARLFGAMEHLLASIHATLGPEDRRHSEDTIVAARTQLDETTYRGAWAAGQALSIDEAIEEALRMVSAEQ